MAPYAIAGAERAGVSGLPAPQGATIRSLGKYVR